METPMQLLQKMIREKGQKLPKKHGDWYKLNIFDNHYLVLDTWNGSIVHYIGCEDTGTENMYRVIYTFKGYVGYVKSNMVGFWLAYRNLIRNI